MDVNSFGACLLEQTFSKCVFFYYTHRVYKQYFDLLAYLLTYLLTYLLHGAESFLRS